MSMTVIGNQNLIFGTCVLGDTFGTIEDANEQLLADLELIQDCCGGTDTALLKNPRYELDLTVTLDSTATPPELGASISFPTAGITGQITQRGRTWSQGGVAKMTIKAFHWKSLGNSPSVEEVECT